MPDVVFRSILIALVATLASCSSTKQLATIKQQGLSVVKDQARGLKDKAVACYDEALATHPTTSRRTTIEWYRAALAGGRTSA